MNEKLRSERTLLLPLLLVVLTVMIGCAGQTPLEKAPVITAPVAAQHLVPDTLFGVERVDPYFWLRGRDNPEVIDYLNAENEYTDSKLAHTLSLQDSLYEEMLSRIQENDVSVPVRDGDWYYYEKEEEGKAYPIHMRKPVSGEGEPQIVLDENVRADGRSYYSVGVFAVSPDQNLLAFAEDTSGRETYTLRFRNLDTGELLPDVVDSVYYSQAWSADSKYFYYVTLDEALRPYKVHRHKIGSSEEDAVVFTEPDERFFVDVTLTNDKAYLLIQAESKLTTEILALRADTPEGDFSPVLPREENVLYEVDHRKGNFLIRINDTGLNFRIVSTPDDNTAKENWRELVPQRDDVFLEGMQAFTNRVALVVRENAIRSIRLLTPEDGSMVGLDFPESVYVARPSDNVQFDTDTLRVTYSSPVTPTTVYDVNMIDLGRVVKKQDEVGGDFDPDRYTVKQIMATARDGAEVPVTLVMLKGLEMDGQNPCLLYGYGSYGITYDPWFSSGLLTLVDRGFVFARAHVRGSSAKGRGWYEQGKMLNKMNTFTDFIDVAEALIEDGYTNPDKMTALGGSAGGLLVGAVANMRPDLFTAMVAAVPFVDVVNTMLDESIPLTVTEYEEWGNPNIEQYFQYMLSYSPYDNVKAQEYPDLLITAGLYDPRVQYWEPAKWTAKLRATKTGGHVYLKTNMEAGHGGASGRYGRLRETAFEFAFLIDSVR